MICSNFTTFAVESPIGILGSHNIRSCDLLKFHYLCGRITNARSTKPNGMPVVICSNFTTFAVESPIIHINVYQTISCDLLKFHYLCGRITNIVYLKPLITLVVICSNFTTFAVESPILRVNLSLAWEL